MEPRQVIVEKIGGTSMSRFAEVLDNVILRPGAEVYGRVFVVSAYGGVTNLLLEHKKSGVPGIYSSFAEQADYASALTDLEETLCSINKGLAECGLDCEVADAFITTRIRSAAGYLDNIAQVLASGYVNRHELLMAARELLASIGESHSAFNSAAILRARGYHSTLIDLSGWDDSRQLTIDERLSRSFASISPLTTVCFVTGYCKGTEGIMREFDRGYSEVTFSKVACLLQAKEARIHKEFHLCSGDPLLIGGSKVHPVCNTNFDVADQLADVGMEAIHPKASKPLELKEIPIRVMNAFDPEHEGTLITKEYRNASSRVEVVTGSRKVTSISVHDTQMVGAVGFDLRIMETLGSFGVSYICKMTNANTIEIVIADRDVTAELMASLERQFELVKRMEVAVVSVIGSNIATPGILALAAGALAGAEINILAVSQTSRQTNMQFIVERQDFEEAQRALHRSLCESD